MKSIKKLIPNGVLCLVIILALFGYMGSVMGMSNMMNTIMNTAHSLLIDTVFYLMGMCVITSALGKILMEFGVVDLLQKVLRPVLKPLFNMPGVASVVAVITFLSDRPAVMGLAKNSEFAHFFKRYQHISLVNFGGSFSMGLLVIIFMVGQGFFGPPLIGLLGAVVGGIINTRLMQYFVCKDYPAYRDEDVQLKPIQSENAQETVTETSQNIFIRVLNALLDGGREGVTIGLAIIPGVLIICTFVMMMTFGGTVEGLDAQGNDIVVYTGKAFQGTQLLPWLAGKIDFVFEYLFGFTAPELIAFPVTALGAVGAALSLIPEFVTKGIINDNAIAVFTAMGMCWSGYLSADAATLDSLGYRHLVPKAFISTFVGGLGAGIVAHWLFAAFTYISLLFAPNELWSVDAQAWNDITNESIPVKLTAYDDGTYTVSDWYMRQGYGLSFSINPADSSMLVTNAYAQRGDYYFVHINQQAKPGTSSYAALYTKDEYSHFEGNSQRGYCYVFAYIYDNNKRQLNRCYYEVTWGGNPRQTFEVEQEITKQMDEERLQATIKADSIRQATLVDSILQEKYKGN